MLSLCCNSVLLFSSSRKIWFLFPAFLVTLVSAIHPSPTGINWWLLLSSISCLYFLILTINPITDLLTVLENCTVRGYCLSWCCSSIALFLFCSILPMQSDLPKLRDWAITASVPSFPEWDRCSRLLLVRSPKKSSSSLWCNGKSGLYDGEIRVLEGTSSIKTKVDFLFYLADRMHCSFSIFKWGRCFVERNFLMQAQDLSYRYEDRDPCTG